MLDLDLADIERAAASIVKPDSMVWVVVGDLAKIEAGVREPGFGRVQRLSPNGELLN